MITQKLWYWTPTICHVSTVLVMSHDGHEFVYRDVTMVQTLNVIEINTAAVDSERGGFLFEMRIHVCFLWHYTHTHTHARCDPTSIHNIQTA